jgi:hypothetical protein
MLREARELAAGQPPPLQALEPAAAPAGLPGLLETIDQRLDALSAAVGACEVTASASFDTDDVLRALAAERPAVRRRRPRR